MVGLPSRTCIYVEQLVSRAMVRSERLKGYHREIEQLKVLRTVFRITDYTTISDRGVLAPSPYI